jgi:hypothetical protein
MTDGGRGREWIGGDSESVDGGGGAGMRSNMYNPQGADPLPPSSTCSKGR